LATKLLLLAGGHYLRRSERGQDGRDVLIQLCVDTRAAQGRTERAVREAVCKVDLELLP
jgi:hypothetical protein